MNKNRLTVEYLKNNDLILFECLAGSHLFGTYREDSDKDYRGIFILPQDYLYNNEYVDQINDSTNDTTYYELNRFLELAYECKPNVIEMLFAPLDKITKYDNVLDPIFNRKNEFINSTFAKSTIGFAESQIKKAVGLNKLLNIEEKQMTRKGVLDFCYTEHKQGSTHIVNWLRNRGLHQEFCGLVNIPNMRDCHGVYYDFWQHIQFVKLSLLESLKLALKLNKEFDYDINLFTVIKEYKTRVKNWRNYKFKGIVNDKNSPYKHKELANESNDISLCEIPKGLKRICMMHFNKDGYTVHCKKWREYQEYLNNRNVARYNDVKGHNQKIDGKNLMHMLRGLNMCLEYYETGKMNINRFNIDREFLLSIRKGDLDLNSILTLGKDKIQEINKYIPLVEDNTEFIKSIKETERKIRKIIYG